MSLYVACRKGRGFCTMITCHVQSEYPVSSVSAAFIKMHFFRTRETLASGNLLSVINVLMQLRKVCNHPNLFEVRPTISPLQCEGIRYHIPSIVYSALEYDPFKVRLICFYLKLTLFKPNIFCFVFS